MKLAKIPDKFPLRYTSAYKILPILHYDYAHEQRHRFLSKHSIIC